MFCHSNLPIGNARSVISPVVKDKSRNISDSANYRPIAAMFTIFSKILEHIIVSRCFVGTQQSIWLQEAS